MYAHRKLASSSVSLLTSQARRGRPPGITPARTLQRLLIAEAILNGTRIATIARRFGVSRSWTSREANAPETRVMLTALVEKRADHIQHLIVHALEVINHAFGATKVIRRSRHEVIVVPDHRIRLEAVHLFLKLLATGSFESQYRAGAERGREVQAAARMGHPPLITERDLTGSGYSFDYFRSAPSKHR
jgi:hypothetical protein